MKELNVATGIVTCTINKDFEFSFNPTDAYFIEGLFDAYSIIDQKLDSYKEEVSHLSEPKGIFNLMRKVDQDIRKCLNDAFGADICTPVFGHINTFSSVGDDLPVCINLLLCVMDECSEALSKIGDERTKAKIEKYTEKYRKKNQEKK